MTFSIFEGQESNQIIFQFKANSPAVKFKLTGETDGIFMIGGDGLLYCTKALDRETRAVHHLQLAALDSQGNVVEGPVPITIEVKDINDNRPTFLQSKYEGSVRQNSRPGKPFMYVNATDLDDPNTLNGQLFYQIVIQLPLVNNVMYFQINNKTGAISLTQEGSQELDPARNSFYNLVVSVKDMGGQNENSFSHTTSVDITVRENIWKAPEQVEITENSTEPHPIKITQHLFYATAKDESGKLLAYPVEVHVKVVDINDNPPICPATTVFEVQENEIVGSSIGYLSASDMDEANTVNSILKYKLVDQSPKVPSDGLFLIEEYEGKVQLGKRSLRKQDNPQYNLTVEVADKDFQTLCFVQVHVIDINDQIPIFKVSDYGNMTLPEDTAIGSTILVIEATDADEPFTGSSKILYKIVEGDPEGRLEVVTDPQTNAGYVTIKQALDFEAQPVANIVFKAENPEPLVSGVSYNASSYASFRLTVTDVNEAPVFSQRIFQAKVSEDAAVGTRLGNVTARDPEGLAMRYSLSGDKRGWLKIDSVTGEIFSAAPLDRETESLYRVRVVATEIGGSALSSVADFHLALTDVNDNPPRLAKEYTGLFFCHPLSAAESLTFEVTDDDQQSLWRSQFTFALGRESLKNDWQVSKINGTHARLSTKHTRFEEGVYEIPILLSDEGKPPMQGTVSLSVTFCQCVEGSCFRQAGSHDGIPTVGMAVGILLTTLLVIAGILAVVFYRMKKDEGKGNVENPQSPEAKPLRS
ncbi:cadherin-17 isoform X4 [Chionomys nivalis]|uniref:cadherin-17 isoform X4 n=1 Tax=Chionomys nivalis TaxID=269649 RepID=UPI002599879C|nr:cadherin-17 isoform X4 [Chionomys nivalis]